MSGQTVLRRKAAAETAGAARRSAFLSSSDPPDVAAARDAPTHDPLLSRFAPAAPRLASAKRRNCAPCVECATAPVGASASKIFHKSAASSQRAR